LRERRKRKTEKRKDKEQIADKKNRDTDRESERGGERTRVKSLDFHLTNYATHRGMGKHVHFFQGFASVKPKS